MSSRTQLRKQPLGAGESEHAGGSARGSKRRGRVVVKALLLGGAVALVTKPEVRNRLLDALFGPEEQFEYDSVTEPAAPVIEGDQEQPTPWAPIVQTRSETDQTSQAPAEAELPAWSPGLRRDWAPADPPAPESGGADETAPAAAEDAPPAPTAAEPWPRDEDAPAPPPQPPSPMYERWSRTQDAAGADAEVTRPPPAYEPWSSGDGDTASAAEVPSPAPEQPWLPADERPDPAEVPPPAAPEPWLRADDELPAGAAEPAHEASSPSDDDTPAAVDEQPVPAYELWSRIDDSTGPAAEPDSPAQEAVGGFYEPAPTAYDSLPASDEEPPLHDRLTSDTLVAEAHDAPAASEPPADTREQSPWSAGNGAEAVETGEQSPWSAGNGAEAAETGEQSPWSAGNGAEAAETGEQSPWSAGNGAEAAQPEPATVSTPEPSAETPEVSGGAAEVADAGEPEAPAAPESEPDQPAIGEAHSPRSGWWIPRRRRSEPTREPPIWD